MKILEEPPPDTYFILLATRRDTIIPTLISRLRAIAFSQRKEETAKEILRRVYREESEEFEDLHQYFLAWSANPDTIKLECGKFLEAVRTGNPRLFFAEGDDESAYLKELDDRNTFSAFLAELTNTCYRMYKKTADSQKLGSESLAVFESWNRSLRRQLLRFERMNMSSRLLTEALYREMRSAV